jgi:CheY-like chemotaxis protein
MTCGGRIDMVEKISNPDKSISDSTGTRNESGPTDESLLSWKNRISLWSQLYAKTSGDLSTTPDVIYHPSSQFMKPSGRPLTVRSLPTGTERILVVDDEPGIVSLEEEILSILGYQVVPKTDSMEALGLFRENPGKFDLVITDMNMPSLEGDRLVQKLLELRQDIPIIMCTGSSRVLDLEKVKDLGIRECILKPLGMKSLAETVRKVLDRE